MNDGHQGERLDIAGAAPRQVAGLLRLGNVELDPRVAELIKMRASQINGCAYCIDMHWKDARAAGEDEMRLYLLDAWRESPIYSDRERGGVPDAVWDEAAAQFEEAELAQLLCAIAAINAWNRLKIATRGEPGHYQPEDPAAARAPVGGEAR
jgi:AhpD family alkylhydroperoxidase